MGAVESGQLCTLNCNFYGLRCEIEKVVKIGTVRKSAKVTGTLVVIAAAVIVMRYWYSVSDFDYFDIVKAFMRTKAEIGGVHTFFISLAFWTSVVVSVVNAVLNYKHGLSIIPALSAPLLVMCGLALLFIPDIGFTNIHLFWLICYILIIIGTWFSARQITRFCLANSNFLAMLKDPETKPELKVSQIDFIAAMLLTLVSYILMALVVVGALIFGIGNRELITGTDDITPVITSVRYDIAVEFMDKGEYEKAMKEFRDLDGYSDSEAMVMRCEDLLYRQTYLEAVSLMNRGKYEEARSILWTIYDYRDSAEKIKKCDDLQYGPQYDEAIVLIGEGLYADAIEILEALRDIGYKDEQCSGALKALLTGTWQGNAGSRLTLREDLTCSFIDGAGPVGDGTWDVIDGRLIFQTSALSYELYGDLESGYLTASVVIQADSSSWQDETFTKK